MGKEINTETNKKWQLEDPVCQVMLAYINHVVLIGKTSQNGLRCYKNCCIENGDLMYISGLSNLSPATVVPKSSTSIIIQKLHNNIEAGHPGREGIHNSIQQ